MTTFITSEELSQLGWLLTNAPTAALFQLAVQEYPELTNITLLQARQQFYDRMLIPYSAFYVPPYQQVYKDMVLKDSTVHFAKPNWQKDNNIASCYQYYGFSIQALEKEPFLARPNTPSDHLGFMLTFSAYLLHRSRMEPEIRNALEKFVADNIGLWADQYLNLQQLKAQYLYPVWVTGLVAEGLRQLRANLGIGN